MDDSEDGVTLLGGFIFDVLSEYEGMRGPCAEAFAMAAHLDPAAVDAWVPISTYNRICSWIEANIGVASVRAAGRAIGNRAFERMVTDGAVPRHPTPDQIMEGLRYVASVMVRDPKGRHWQVSKRGPGGLRMRRTQTYNCILQEGLLLSLLERTKVQRPTLVHTRCTRKGAEFCDYDLSWRG